MYAAVFDVNVLVSSLITKGKPRELFLKAKDKHFTLILSAQIISEFINVVSRRKFAKYVKEYDVRVFLEALHQIARFTKVRSRFIVVKEDPTDDIILRTAYDGRADYIVSGDRHLLSLKSFRDIQIVTVNEMLSILIRQEKLR
ncbi:MAG: putative toxin-antitoxin system toxin component, PIN family [Nitrososphaerales archaeon]